MQNDIVLDILERIRAHLQGGGAFDDGARQQLDAEIRADWGGERCYIAKQGESNAIAIIRRDVEMRRAFRAGASVSVVARRFQVSRKTVYRVVMGGAGQVLTDG